MAEYIDRSDALKVIETANSMVSSLLEATMKLCVTMDRIAAADVVPVMRGKWIVLDDCSNEGVYCSVCHKKVFRINYSNTMRMRSKFCPNCGALMDKEGDGE